MRLSKFKQCAEFKQLMCAAVALWLTAITSVPVAHAQPYRPRTEQFNALCFLTAVPFLGALAALALQDSAVQGLSFTSRETPLQKKTRLVYRQINRDYTVTQKKVENYWRAAGDQIQRLQDDNRHGIAYWQAKRDEINARKCEDEAKDGCTPADKTFWLARVDDNINRIYADMDKINDKTQKAADRAKADFERRSKQAQASLDRMARRYGTAGEAAAGAVRSLLGAMLGIFVGMGVSFAACAILTRH